MSDARVVDFADEYRTTGVVQPSGFDEYDQLTGYEAGVYASQWADEKGNVYLRTTTIINLGRPDRGVPVDPDRLLGPEPKPERVNGQATKLQRAHGQLTRDVIDHLQYYGPARAKEIAAMLDCIPDSVRSVLVRHPNLFRVAGKHAESGQLVWELKEGE